MAGHAHPPLGLIAAVARNGAIGRDNALLWLEPLDQRHFRRVTMGAPVLMGRRTWESLPARFRPLPGRRNIVISRNPALAVPGAELTDSLAAGLARLPSDARAWVIGGAKLFALALPLADELELTEIGAEFEGDVFFPPWDRSEFSEVSRERHVSAAGVPFDFVSYRRRR